MTKKKENRKKKPKSDEITLDTKAVKKSQNATVQAEVGSGSVTHIVPDSRAGRRRLSV